MMNQMILPSLIFFWLTEICISGQGNVINTTGITNQNSLLTTSIASTNCSKNVLLNPLSSNFTESARFYFYNDFKEYLQVDKFIHSFASYLGSHILYYGLKNLKVSNKKAIILGGTLSSVLLTSKDLYDGFNLGGFSWTDVLANSLGSACFVGQQLLFDEQIVKFKYSFSRSEYTDQANGYLGKTLLQSYLNDYNGYSFWLSMNVCKILPKTKIPDWISIGVGYSANGMFGAYQNIDSYNGVLIPETKRYRQFLLSPDIDLSKIKVKSRFLRIVLNGMNFIKVPFPAVEFNSMGNIRGYWIYF